MDVTGVKVFSATKAKERELLGEVTDEALATFCHPCLANGHLPPQAQFCCRILW